ncbi:helix-turn-helix protein [Aquimarina sp. MAR_2010_214]|uniref:helix-turn-helix domain-containing protein n=1 Tax=Aquimarina sp. MAR_2010_214 TaxID=1250026 RepID=UPI000C6FFB02|nr:AraC family transcriptional regulator [Aquimarina sp. MAR_2010_214]PKV48545.1 helix-turn-helix protein [Aquimarina sp. MAR_2010_214]
MNYKLLFLLLLCINIESVSYSQVVRDSLLGKSNSELIEGFKKIKNKKVKESYIKAYIKNGKINKDTFSIIDGYTNLSDLYANEEKGINYADSIILLTKNNPNSIYPANGYMLKGERYFFGQKKIKLALDNYLIANKYSERYRSKEINFGSNHIIGILKDKIGYFEEAIQIHQKNIRLVEKEFDESIQSLFMTSSIQAIAFTYKNLGKLDSALYYNDLGMEKALKMNHKSLINHLLLNEGVIHYHNFKLKSSTKAIKESLEYFEKINDKPNMAEGYFYLAKIYDRQQEKVQSLQYLKQVDSIFIETQDLPPDTREAYEILISHYNRINKPDTQLVYLKRLISLDSILSSNKSYVSKNLKNKYDIPKLIKQKEILIGKLKNDKVNLKYISIIISIILIFIIFGLYRRQNSLKKRFNAIIIKEDENLEVQKILSEKTERLDVPKNISNEISQRLQLFEKNQEFTDNKLTLSSLAILFKTNSTYLSKTINYYHDKSFTNYINDLRIEYALKKLKNDHSFRKYTISAIAQESGFKSAETFSKLFKKKNGIYPSYFIKRMKKQPNNDFD